MYSCVCIKCYIKNDNTSQLGSVSKSHSNGKSRDARVPRKRIQECLANENSLILGTTTHKGTT